MEKVGINPGLMVRTAILSSRCWWFFSSAFLILESVANESPSAAFLFTYPAQPCYLLVTCLSGEMPADWQYLNKEVV